MAASPSAAAPDYFSGHRTPRRPAPSVLRPNAPGTPGSPRTPQLGGSRSISAQFGSPGSFRAAAEQEEVVVYEVSERHFAAGYAGEGRPRCSVRFTPEDGRREGSLGRYYAREVGGGKREQGVEDDDDEDYVLYRTDLRACDLRLVGDKSSRALRTIHREHLQLPTTPKPLRAILALPSLLPTPLLEVLLQCLFTHHTQPPSISLLTTPILNCVSAGLRNALVIEIGWEETTVTAVGEYKSICQRRSTRARRLMVQKLREGLGGTFRAEGDDETKATGRIPFAHAEEIAERMAWCPPSSLSLHADSSTDDALGREEKLIPLPLPTSAAQPISLAMLAQPAESTFFPSSTSPPFSHPDDDDLGLPSLAYSVLLRLPLDLRASCLSRIVLTTTSGPGSSLPKGMRERFLAELDALIKQRGWDPVRSYGSAKKPRGKAARALRERSANVPPAPALPPEGMLVEEAASQVENATPLPPSQRPHDDTSDPISLKAERNHGIGRHGQKDTTPELRGVETLGAWAGASLVASLRVQGVHVVEREAFLRGGLGDSSVY